MNGKSGFKRFVKMAPFTSVKQEPLKVENGCKSQVSQHIQAFQDTGMLLGQNSYEILRFTRFCPSKLNLRELSAANFQIRLCVYTAQKYVACG